VKSILETCKPRPDILAGAFNPEIFTASLSQVADHYRGRASAIHNLYTDAALFFTKATYPTDGMQMVLSEVMARLAGNNTVPAIHRLETAFGGGKTHTLIALIHLGFLGRELNGVAAHCFKTAIFDPVNLLIPGEAQVVSIAGDEVPVHQPKGTALTPYTLWGEMAFQLGGEELYQAVEDEATSYAAPGKAFLQRIFSGRKVIVLLDELAQYATRFNAAYPNGADQLAAFLMALNGYARTHSGLSVALTLAGQADAFAGQTRRLANLLSEIRGEQVTEDDAASMAESALVGVRSVVARDATGVVPVQANEISRVLAQRLFDAVDLAGAEDTLAAYWDMYQKNGGLLPDRATREDFRGALRELYPFHPTFVEFLNQKMATLENFQGTRGVLRVLALAVRSLWEKQQAIPMIHTCHLNLRDARIANEIISRTGGGDLLPILNTDVGGVDTAALIGGSSRAQEADRKNPHPQGFPLYEYAWKTVFLHSLVGRSEGLGTNLFGIGERDALLETAFPGLTPPQVQAALQAIEDSDRGAFYLRHSKQYARYYASLDASINRALAAIRGSLESGQIRELLDAATRKIIRTDATFQVAHDVSLPEHIPDKTGRAGLGLIALGADEIDAEAFVTTVGPNRPRIQQNLVFLLVPRTVHVKGEVWNEDRVVKAREARSRLEELARDVMARRRLRDKPENHGIKPKQLADEEFDAKTRERELALQTTITQHYDSLWYPSASGQVVRKEVHTAGGESGASIVEEIRRVLHDEGELITEERARTREVLTSLGQLFFASGQTPTLEPLRNCFLVNRRWPVLDSPALFDHIIREGLNKGLWCLFRMADEVSTQPEAIYARDTEAIPLDLDLKGAGWSIVAVSGAKQRGWLGGKVEVDPSKVEAWISDVVKEQPVACVSEIITKVVSAHGEIPEKDVLAAIDNLVREERMLSYTGQPEQQDKPAQLMHGPSAILHAVAREDIIVSPAEAARRGWVVVEQKQLNLQGKDTADQLLALLKRLGSLYARGAQSKLDVFDLAELRLPNGGRMRLLLQDVPPADMKRLGELFEIVGDLASAVEQTQGRIRITDPQDHCLLVQELKKKV
jgi:hypothetical protein